MNKSMILEFITRYTVSNIDAVAWEIGTNQLKARFITDDKSMIGETILHNFESQDTGSKLGIFKTSKLEKMLAVLNNEINMSIEKLGDKMIALIFADNKNEIRFALSDLAVIPHVPPMKYIPSKFESAFKIDSEIADTYLRAVASMPEITLFSVEPNGDKFAKITMGQTDVNTDRVVINADIIKNEGMNKMHFNSQILADILKANKGVDAKFEISNEGLGRILIESKEYMAVYHFVAKKV